MPQRLLIRLVAILFAVGVVALTALMQERIGILPALLLAILGTVASLTVLGSVRTLVGTFYLASALRRAKSHRPPEDGDLVDASGPIQPDGDAMSSPFCGEPCVAYSYDIREKGQTASEFFGIALTPSTVSTSAGALRLLGFRLLENLSEHKPGPEFESTEAMNEVLRRSASPATRLRGPKGLLRYVDDLLDAFEDDDGNVQMDWRRSEAPRRLERLRFTERRVEPGQTVTVVGRFSRKKHGLLASRQHCEFIEGGLRRAHNVLVSGPRRLAFFGLGWSTFLLTIVGLAVWRA